MKKNKIISTFFLMISSVLLFLSCENDDPVKSRQNAIRKLYNRGSAKIAVANSFEKNQTNMWNGVILAQEKIKAENLCPVDLEFLKYDDGGTPVSGAKTAYEITKDEEICAVVGHGYSDVTLPCSLIYQYYGVMAFNFISTLHSLNERGNPLFFSNMPDDEIFARELARLCERNKYENVLIYYLENKSGISLSNNFEIQCNRRSISVASRDSFDLSTNEVGFNRVAKRWKNNYIFDAIFVVGRMPAISQIIDVIRENKIECPIIGADPFDDPLLESYLPETENGRIFAVSNFDKDSENEKFREFYESYKKRFEEEPDQEALQAYDAVIVLAKAIAFANSAVPSDIVAEIRKREWDEGAGPYSSNEQGEMDKQQLVRKVFQDGKFVKYFQ